MNERNKNKNKNYLQNLEIHNNIFNFESNMSETYNIFNPLKSYCTEKGANKYTFFLDF